MPLLQRYAYANDDPANLVDPSGLSPESDRFHELMAAEEQAQAWAKKVLSDPCWLIHPFCKSVALVWKEAKKGIGWCLDHSSCTRGIGSALLVTGSIAACPFTGIACAGLVVIGAGILAGDDLRGCRGGSDASCAMMPVDIFLGAVGVGSALDVGSIGVVTVGGALRQNAAWRAAVSTSGGGAAIQVLPDLIYQFRRNDIVTVGNAAWDLGNTTAHEAR
jgi:hypothetical protein